MHIQNECEKQCEAKKSATPRQNGLVDANINKGRDIPIFEALLIAVISFVLY